MTLPVYIKMCCSHRQWRSVFLPVKHHSQIGFKISVYSVISLTENDHKTAAPPSVVFVNTRPGLANREYREDSRWAGLFFWLRGLVFHATGLKYGCCSKLPARIAAPLFLFIILPQPHSFYLLFYRSPSLFIYYFLAAHSQTSAVCRLMMT